MLNGDEAGWSLASVASRLVQPPSGTVTFLFTDIEGSTRRWQDDPEAMRALLAAHDEVLRRLIDKHHGHVFKHTGDGVAAVFASAADATAAAVDAQDQLGDVLPVRMGLHTGEAELREGDYFGTAVNRVARIMSVAHGGQIVCSQPTADLARDVLGDRVAVSDLGEHRLRDLTNLERIFQVGAPGVVRTFPPLRSLDTMPGNLPRQVTTFVGREGEIASLSDLVRQASLVTLTGVGGVGKTRLALQAAAELLPRTRDGAFLVEFGAVVDPSVVAEVVASALSLQLAGGQVAVDAVVAHLASRQLLLVLDNCEHLLDAVAAFVQAVMRACPDVWVLATSREGLGLPGEHIVPVGSLVLPVDGDPFEAQLAAPAMQLLIDRALLVRPDFAPTPETLGALTQVCRRLDGIPLALELAAARLRSMTPSEIATRLDERFRLLTGGGRGAANRHQTLRRTIDWSYDLLDAEERLVLERASVFAGGFDLSAADSVCSGEGVDSLDMVEYLGRLVDKSLLVADEVEGTTRYRMLETVRDYALERLDARAKVTDVRRLHAEHYAGFASQAGAGLRGRDERVWIERTERELENLRVAVLWSVESGNSDVACEIVGTLALEMNRLDHAVGSWAERIAMGPEVATSPQWARVLAFAAFSAVQHRDHERGRIWRDAARTAAAVEGTAPVVVARVFDSDMIVSMMIDGWDAYVRVGDERVVAARACGESYELARALASLAVALGITGGDGRALAREASEVAGINGNPTVRSSAALALAQTSAPDDYAARLAFLADAEQAAQDAGNDSLVVIINGMRANTLLDLGNAGVALPSLLATAETALRRGYFQYVTGCLTVVAGTLAIAEHHEAATTLYGYIGSVDPGGLRDWMPDQVREVVAALPEQLGAARYEELTRQGAQLDTDAALAFAREAVTGLLEATPQS
jgi:predicted ATPase/class 3 adenylate cyclase